MSRDAGGPSPAAGRRWTGAALAYCIIGAATVVAGAILAGPILVLLGSVVLLAPFVDGLLLRDRAGSGHLDVSRQRIREGDAVSVKVDVERSRGNQQIHVDMSPAFDLESGDENLFAVGGKEMHRRFEATAKARGPHDIGPLTIRTWSPLRLWSKDRVMERSVTVEVIPRMEPVDEVAIVSDVLKPMQGRFQVNRPGQGFDFFTLRQYTSGDTIRDVNWKASARGEELIVNQRQVETFSEMVIFLDARTTQGVGPIGSTPLDRDCRAAVTLFTAAAKERDTVRFYSYGARAEGLPPSRDRTQTLETRLANLKADGSTSIRAAWEKAKLDVRSSGPVLILTSTEGDPDLVDTCSQLVGRGHPVTVVSPRPADQGWEHQPWRQKMRERTMGRLRATGVVVADWKVQEPVRAEKPMQLKVIK